MKNKINLIIDFDSTLVEVETLDVLAEVCLPSNKINEIKKITNEGMLGKISFEDSLRKRFELLNLNKSHLIKAREKILNNITDSALKNLEKFREHKDNIYILSGGFKEFIIPIAKMFEIPEEHIYANNFIFENGKIYYDENNLLSKNQGKLATARRLCLTRRAIVIGDGFTDLEIKKENAADFFIAFSENVKRPEILQDADFVANNFDDVFNIIRKIENKKPKALFLENINDSARNLLTKYGFDVESFEGSLDEDELIKKIKDVNVLGIRSKTQVTKKLIDNANNLSIIGAFCVGTDQIDLDYCNQKNIKIINAPFSNTRSVAELALGEIIILFRNIISFNYNLHDGIWNKKSNGSFEIKGKKLGIVGYGNVGTQLGILAESIGMNVYFYDIAEKLPIGNAAKINTLEELLKISDVVSVHVDGRISNKYLISEKEFKIMKKGVIFLNLSRGIVVDYKALAKNLNSRKIRGAAIDVFENEPEKNGNVFESPLKNLKNVILTPHIGGSTEEAQKAIGEYVSERIVKNFL